jgi:hypothetical protein
MMASAVRVSWSEGPAARDALASAKSLVPDGEQVLDVPARLAARVRVLSVEYGRKSDPDDAVSVAVAQANTRLVQLVGVGPVLAAKFLGEVGDIRRFRSKHQGLGEALARLVRHGQPAELPVIIEGSTGLVVDRLLAAGHPVAPVHPTAFHAARPRWALPVPRPILVTATSWPTTCAPTATGCAGSNPWIQACGNCRPWSGCGRIMSAPAPPPAPAGRAAGRLLARTQGQVLQAGQRHRVGLPDRLSNPTGRRPARPRLLRSLQTAIGELETAIKQQVAQHPRAKLLRGLPGVGTINLAQLLAEVGPILDRVSTARAGRRRMRRGASHQGLGQDQRGLLPLGR